MASIYQIGLIHKVGRSAASGCMERRMGAATPLCVWRLEDLLQVATARFACRRWPASSSTSRSSWQPTRRRRVSACSGRREWRRHPRQQRWHPDATQTRWIDDGGLRLVFSINFRTLLVLTLCLGPLMIERGGGSPRVAWLEW